MDINIFFNTTIIIRELLAVSNVDIGNDKNTLLQK